MSLIVPIALRFTTARFPELNISGAVYSVITDSADNNFIFGDFLSVQGNTRYNMAKLSNGNVLDGGFGITNVYGVTYSCSSGFDIATNQEIFFIPSNGLDKIKKSDSSVVQVGTQYINGLVYKIITDTDNSGVFLLGSFTKIGTTPRNKIAKINASDLLVSTWNCNPPTGYGVFSMGLCKTTSHLYVVGNFTSIRSVARKFIARVRKDTGAVDLTFNANTSVSGMDSVSDLYILPDDSIIVVGTATNKKHLKLLRISYTGATIWSHTIATTSSNFEGLKIRGKGENIFIYYYVSPIVSSTKYGTLYNYTSGGTLNTAFNSPSGYISIEYTSPTVYPIIQDMTINSTGHITLGGKFDKVNNIAKTNYTVLEPTGTVLY
jgi:hypothetical protein